MRQPDPEVYNQIALSLARRYDCVYYVDIDTGNYMQYLDVMDVKKSDVPRYGEHFFEDAVKNADKFIHPDDLNLIMDFFDRKNSGRTWLTREVTRLRSGLSSTAASFT